MKRFIPFAFVAIVSASIVANVWSQSTQSGGDNTGTGTGSANAVGTAGTTGTAGTPGVSGTVTAPGAAGTVGTAPRATGPSPVGVENNPVGRNTVGTNSLSRNAGFNVGGNINERAFFADPGVRQQLNLNANQFNTLNRVIRTHMVDTIVATTT